MGPEYYDALKRDQEGLFSSHFKFDSPANILIKSTTNDGIKFEQNSESQSEKVWNQIKIRNDNIYDGLSGDFKASNFDKRKENNDEPVFEGNLEYLPKIQEDADIKGILSYNLTNCEVEAKTQVKPCKHGNLKVGVKHVGICESGTFASKDLNLWLTSNLKFTDNIGFGFKTNVSVYDQLFKERECSLWGKFDKNKVVLTHQATGDSLNSMLPLYGGKLIFSWFNKLSYKLSFGALFNIDTPTCGEEKTSGFKANAAMAADYKVDDSTNIKVKYDSKKNLQASFRTKLSDMISLNLSSKIANGSENKFGWGLTYE